MSGLIIQIKPELFLRAKLMTNENDQTLVNAISPEILESNRAGLKLGKYFLYAAFLVLFCMTGFVLGAGTVSYNRDILFHEELGIIGHEPELWNWKSSLLYGGIILLSFGLWYLAHYIQRKLSRMSYRDAPVLYLLALVDWAFSVLNALCFCFAFYVGLMSAMLSISFQLGPPS